MNYIKKLEELKKLSEKAFAIAKEIHEKTNTDNEPSRFYRLYSEAARLRRTSTLALEFEKVDWNDKAVNAIKEIYK